MVPEYRISDTIPFQTALKEGAAHTFRPVSLTREDTALLQYTGGTTGVAKGAILSHGNICANMQQAAEWIVNLLQPGKETVIAALPLYHIFALTVNLMIFTPGRFQNHPDYQPARHEKLYRRHEKRARQRLCRRQHPV